MNKTVIKILIIAVAVMLCACVVIAQIAPEVFGNSHQMFSKGVSKMIMFAIVGVAYLAWRFISPKQTEEKQ